MKYGCQDDAAFPDWTAPMRMKPPPSSDDAYKFLTLAAEHSWGAAEAALMETQLRAIADAMAAVAALDIPDDVEPLYAEDIALDTTGAR
jgi:hypothetical protein